MNLIKIFTFTIAAGFFAGNALAADKDIATKSVSITFGAGVSKLTDDDKTELRNLVRDGLKAGEIDHVTVAAWSDRAMPAQGTQLSKTDRGLAKERLNVISTYLKSEMELNDVDTYNMAENANWLARTFNTRDAELKSFFGRTDGEMDATGKRSEFRVIRQSGGPSTAVVVLSQDTN